MALDAVADLVSMWKGLLSAVFVSSLVQVIVKAEVGELITGRKGSAQHLRALAPAVTTVVAACSRASTP